VWDALTYPQPRDERGIVSPPLSVPAVSPPDSERYIAGGALAAVVGARGQLQIYNPGVPGREILIDRVVATQATAGLIYLERGTVRLPDLDRRWRGTWIGGYPGNAEFRTGSAAAGTGETMITNHRVLADTAHVFELGGLRLGDGETLTFVGGLNNVAISARFEGRERAI
jgi:hypothetical protein